MERSADNASASSAAAVWTLSDGHAGNLRQTQALAQALGFAPQRDWMLAPRAPWRWLAPRRLPAATAAFGPEFAEALNTPPPLAIGCGRQAALATRLLRARGAKTVQLLDPRIAPRHWDVVVAPAHDRLRGGNVVSLLGSLHPVDDLWLARARSEFAAFARLPRPRTALLLGGPSRHAEFDHAEFDALAAQLDTALARDGGSLLATTSRRTPDAVARALAERYGGIPGVRWYGETSDGSRVNPYPGVLAWADRIVCSADSVNMLSEACATAVPVHVFAPQRTHGRVRDFVEALLQRGRIHALDPALAPFAVEPLRETARVAAEVRQRLGV